MKTADKENALPLEVSVNNDKIVVTMPGTDFCVTYRKPPNEPGLIASANSDPNVTVTKSEFKARAWTAAN